MLGLNKSFIVRFLLLNSFLGQQTEVNVMSHLWGTRGVKVGTFSLEDKDEEDFPFWGMQARWNAKKRFVGDKGAGESKRFLFLGTRNERK